MNSITIFGALLAAIVAVVLITRNKKLLFWLPFLAVFLPVGFIDRFFVSLPALVKWLPQLLFMGCAVLSAILYSRQKIIMPGSILWIYIVFLLLSIFSLTYNETSVIQLILSQRAFIYIIGAVLFLKSAYNKYTLDDIYTFMVKAGLVMAGLGVFERVVFVMLLKIESGDIITGTFSIDGEYLFYQVICIIIVFSYWIERKKLIKMSPGNTLLILIGSIAIANNKAGIIFIMAVITFFAFQTGLKLFWQHSKKLIYIASFVIIGLLAFDLIFRASYNRDDSQSYAYLTDPEFITTYLFGDESEGAEGKFQKGGIALKRGAAIEFAYSLIKRDGLSYILGKGPGAVSESGGQVGYISEKYPGYQIGRTTIALLLAEFGFGGIICYLLFLSAIYFWTPKTIKYRREHKFIRKTVVFFMILYAPYQAAILWLTHALAIGIIIYPNLESWLGKNTVEEKSETSVQSTDIITHQIPMK